MSKQMQGSDVLRVLMLIYANKADCDILIKEVSQTLYNLDLWRRKHQDEEYTHLKAFAPEVYDAYVKFLTSCQNFETSHDTRQILINVLHLTKTCTGSVYDRMRAETALSVQLEKEIDAVADVSDAHVTDTLKNIFRQ